MKPDEVKALAHRGEKEDRVSYWLQPSKYPSTEFREAWHRIGPNGAIDWINASDGSFLSWYHRLYDEKRDADSKGYRQACP
jgi:hypothetical protein